MLRHYALKKIVLTFTVIFATVYLYSYIFTYKVKQRNSSIRTNKWIVLETKSGFTCDKLITIAVENPQWGVVVADEDKSCNSLKGNIHHIISSEYEIFKGYSDINSRKKMACIWYAIQVGAKYIYEGDINLQLSSDSLSSFFTKRSKYMVPTVKNQLINPYLHFGQNRYQAHIINKLSPNKYYPNYKLLPVNPPSIQYSIFSTTEDKFDETAPPFVLPELNLSPLDSRNSLIRVEAFWALFIPFSYDSDTAFLLRTLFAQKLLLHGNFSIAINPSNEISVFDEFKNRNYDIEKVKKFTTFLLHWKCKSLWARCDQFLAQDLTKNGLWSEDDLKMYNLWIEKLKNLNVLPFRHEGAMNNIPVLPALTKEFIFYPVPQDLYNKRHDDSKNLELFKDICKGSSHSWFSQMLKKNSNFSDVLLMIHFNYKSREKVIEMLRILYKPQFPTILLCGDPSDKDLAKSLELTLIPSYKNHHTYNSIDCNIMAMEMGYQVAGYLHIHDDNIIHPWNMVSWNRSKVWYTPVHKWMCSSSDATNGLVYSDNGTHIYKNKKIHNWIFGKDEFPKLIKVFDQMKLSPEGSSWHQCYVNRMKRLKGVYRFDYAQADHYYIPSRKSKAFSEVLTIFLQYDIYFEIATTTAIKCVEPPENHKLIRFRHLYGPMRRNEAVYYKHLEYPYVHPYKLGKLYRNLRLRQDLFCDEMIAQSYKRW